MTQRLLDGRLGPRRPHRPPARRAPGPTITRAEAAAVVAELHEAAADRRRPTSRASPACAPPGGPAPEVVVVDRPGWVQANADGLAALLDPLVDTLTEKQGSRPGALADAIGSRVTGVEVGGAARLPRLAGARPVRPVLRHRRPAAAGRPEHRARRARARRRPAPTSGSGSACTRRPTGCSSPPCPGCATTSRPRSPSFVDATDLDPPRSLRERLQDVAAQRRPTPSAAATATSRA